MPFKNLHSDVRSWFAKTWGRSGRHRGQSLVEMALLAPVLVLLLFSVVEMGRLFLAWVTVQHAARTGVRVAITGQGEQPEARLALIQSVARDAASHLRNVEIRVRSWDGAMTVGSGREGDPGGPCDLVEVEVRHTYRPVIALMASLLPEPINLIGRERKLNEPWRSCE